MTRARSARNLRSVALVAVLVTLASLGVVEPGPSALTMVRLPRVLDSSSRAQLQSMLDTARRADRASAEVAWLRVAVFALEHTSFSEKGDKDVTKALEEACGRLPARSLAAAGAHGAHPILSRYFAKAILKEWQTDGSGRAEAAAEARDALSRFGPNSGNALFDMAKKNGAPAIGGGGTLRSVYNVRVLVASSRDANSGVSAGVRSGVRAAAGEWADRFDIRSTWIADGEDKVAFAVDRLDGDVRPGVLLVAADGPVYISALTHGLAGGAIVVDARSRGAQWSSLSDAVPVGPDSGHAPVDFPWFSPNLEYGFSMGTGMPTSAWQQVASFVLRPPGIERGRRLAEVLRGRPSIQRVVIALPESGGDVDLALGLAGGLRALGREVQFLTYSPGRRDFAPEARRFALTEATAILLTGGSGEASDWLASLSKLQPHPLVLGSTELAPDGFHARDRGRLEGALYVGEEWEDKDPAFRRRAEAAIDSAATEDIVGFQRGFRFGFVLAREVLEGAFTPSALARGLSLRAQPSKVIPSTRSLVRFDDSDRLAWSVELPVFVIRGGEAVRASF